MEEYIVTDLDNFRELSAALRAYNSAIPSEKRDVSDSLLEIHDQLRNSQALDHLARHFPNVARRITTQVNNAGQYKRSN